MAKITQLPNGDLDLVCNNGHPYRRRAGEWQLLSANGNWFPCDIHCPITRRQVEDFECCLRPYALEETPKLPTGRRKLEPLGEFIRRTQIAELRKGALNLFAPVPMAYDHMAETRRRLANYMTQHARARIPA